MADRDRLSGRPDLFIVGAPKAGTTSLYEYLKGHPQVFMSPAKEQPPRREMSAELRRQLQQEFAPDVAQVGELLGRDLAALWWKREGKEAAREKGEPVLIG